MGKQVYDLVGRAAREGGETVLGLKDLDTHACYMIYGVVEPGEPARLFKPGVGHEEIICVVGGCLELTREGVTLSLQPGQAVHLVGDETWQGRAPGPLEARYVASGGHSTGGHGHGHQH